MAIALEQSNNWTPSGSGTTNTNAFDCGDGDFLTVTVHGRPGLPITGVTYNGVSMTQGVHAELSGDKIMVDVWYLADPASGSNDIVVTSTTNPISATQGQIGAQSWSSVDKSDPVDATNTETGNGANSTAITTIEDNSMIISCFYTNGDPITGVPNTEIYNIDAGDKSLAVSYLLKVTAGSETFTYTDGSTNERGHALISLNESTSVNYTLTAAVGAFTLTGIAATLTSARSMVASVGTFTLTGFAAALKRGYGILASLGTFTLTGSDTALKTAYTMTAAVGSFTLTGFAATFQTARKLVASVGSFILTGSNAILKAPIRWINQSKNSATISNSATKNAISPTNVDKSNT